jgi:cysteine-rich repeat protein
MINSAPIMFPGIPGDGVIPDVMKFIVGSQTGHTAPLPGTLRPLDRIPVSESVRTRQFELRKSSDPCTGSIWTINGLRFEDITEFPELGTTEIWEFVNRSGVMHPMHLHLVMFQILNRQPFQVINNQIVPTGTARPPAPEEDGWKDTVQTTPNEITRVIVRFRNYAGRFPYHCHIIEHEDQEMMRQFQTIQCGNGSVEPTEQCDDGNTAWGDRCSGGCNEEEFLHLDGVAQGGSVSVTVAGEVVTIATTAGQTPSQVAAALAAAINADPELAAMGFAARAYGSRVIADGPITGAAIADAGLIDRMTLYADAGSLWWSEGVGQTGCDVVRGGLGVLRSSRGDFTLAAETCLADDHGPSYLALSSDPAPGEGWWFLARKVTGAGPATYDDGSASQSGLRDAEIAASPAPCP